MKNDRHPIGFLRLLLCLLALAPFQVGAVSWNASTDYLWNVGTGKIDVFPGQGSGNVWSAGEMKASSAGPQLSKQKALPFNPSPTANFKTTFTPKNIAKAILSPQSAIINLALYAGINALLDDACTRLAGGSMSLAPGGQWEECKYRDEIQTEWSTQTSPVFKGTTPDAAAAGWWASATTTNAKTCSGSGPSLYCQWVEFVPKGCAVQYNQMTCKAERHAKVSHATQGDGDTVSNVSIGMSSASVTQKVKDGWQPSDETKVAAALEPKLTTMSQADFSNGYHGTSGQAGRVVDEIIRSGNGIDIDAVTATGPATSPSTTTTTTTINNAGDTVNKNTTTTNNYTYDNRVGPTTVTVTNTSSVVTTTTNSKTGETTTETTQKPEDSDPCAKTPDSVACAKLGTPEAQTLDKKDKAVVVTPEVFTSMVGCIPPLSFSAFGKTYFISWQPLCDIMIYIKAIITAICAMVAFYVLADSFRVT